jgi:hypothetical protein
MGLGKIMQYFIGKRTENKTSTNNKQIEKKMEKRAKKS